MSNSTPTAHRKLLTRAAATFLLGCGSFGLAITAAAQSTSEYTIDKKFSFEITDDVFPKYSHVGGANTSATGATPASSSEQTAPYPGTPISPPGVFDLFTQSVGPKALGVANSEVLVNDLEFKKPVTGTVHVDGFVKVDAPGNGAHADSNSLLRITGLTDKSGTVTTNAISTLQTKKIDSTDKNAAKLKDPMSFEIFDLDNGELLKAILLDFTMTLEGDGDVEWDEDGMDIDATDFTFNYDLTSPFLKNNGLIDFAIVGGVVTKSVGTGILAGFLPSVGSTGVFHLNLSSEISLEYDLGDFGGHRVDISFIDEASGSADVVAVPEPGTMAAGIALAGVCLVQLRRRRAVAG